MKRFILTGLLLLGVMHTSSFAQSTRSYEDDIYSTGEDARKAKERTEEADRNRQRYQTEEAYDNTYNSSGSDNGSNGNYDNYARSYDNDGYIDYDDDYYYSTQINRFNRPFYNMGYWSSFYNPYWYDPFWADPYGVGWNYWSRPGFSVSIGWGWGQPYWSSYWGWYNWYGYTGFNSFWYYPFYGGGWGGGYWAGYNNGYYNGYWNGYYSGLYGGRPYRSVTYGPRASVNSGGSYGFRGENGLRQQAPVPGSSSNPYGPRAGVRRENGNAPAPVRENTGGRISNIPDRNGNALPGRENAGDRGNNNGNLPSRQQVEGQQQVIRDNSGRVNGNTIPERANTGDRPARGRFQNMEDRPGDRTNNWNNGNNNNNNWDREQPVRRFEQPRQDAPPQQPRYEQPRMEQPRYERPRMEQPRYEQPRFEQPRYEQRNVPQPRFEQPRSMPAPAPRMDASPRMSPGGGGGRFGGR